MDKSYAIDVRYLISTLFSYGFIMSIEENIICIKYMILHE